MASFRNWWRPPVSCRLLDKVESAMCAVCPAASFNGILVTLWSQTVQHDCVSRANINIYSVYMRCIIWIVGCVSCYLSRLKHISVCMDTCCGSHST